MSRYDDPRWYEEQDRNPRFTREPAYDQLNQYPPYPPPGNGIPQSYNAYPPRYYVGLEPRPRRILGQILALVALVALAFLGGWFGHQLFGESFFSANDKSKTYSQLFNQAWNTIDQNYVDRKAIDYQKMSYAAIRAMTDSLNDKGHTRFLTPEQVKSENQQLSGEFIGIGINLNQDAKTKQLTITSVIPGSPAEKAGFKRGDVILAVDNTDVAGKSIPEVSKLIQGQEGTTVTLKIQRNGETQTISVKRAKIKVPNVIMHYISESGIAHIQILQFADGIASQTKDAVNKAKGMGAKKIILDLRDNPGGYLNEAQDLVSLFVQDGTVLLEQDSSGKRTPMKVNGNAIDTTMPIVVLVNENSASAAEITAGSLQENNRAIVMGQKTFGTGTVLQQFNLSDGSAILIGVQEWLTPNGQFIRDKGIMPNTQVKLPAGAAPLTANEENVGKMTEQQILNSGDTQLKEAIQYLKSR